jgi:hypothetical protein
MSRFVCDPIVITVYSYTCQGDFHFAHYDAVKLVCLSSKTIQSLVCNYDCPQIRLEKFVYRLPLYITYSQKNEKQSQ